jgi:hypothetical protein
MHREAAIRTDFSADARAIERDLNAGESGAPSSTSAD